MQLKSAESVAGRPRVRIRVATYNYWVSQSRPVLLVLYDHETGSLWARFAHHINPSIIKLGAETFTVHFTEGDAWQEMSPKSAEAEVMARSAWSSGRHSLPLPTRCRGRGSINGVGVGLVVQQIRKRLREASDLFDTSSPAGVVQLELEVEADRIKVRIAGNSPSYLVFEPEQYGELDAVEHEIVENISNHLLLLIAQQLQDVGLRTEALRVIPLTLNDNGIPSAAGLFADSVSVLVAGGDNSGALRLLELGFKNGYDDEVAALFPFLAVRLNPANQATLLGVLQDWVLGADSPGDRAPRAYSAANALRSVNPSLAVATYDIAAAADPAYKRRPYWWREKAGALFLSGDYSAAYRAYDEAVRMGDDSSTLLLGDAHLFAGNYKQALGILAEGEGSSDIASAEYRIKFRVFRELIDELGISVQARAPQVAAALVERDDLDARRALEALQADFLCAGALYRLGVDRAERGISAAEWFLGSAFSAESAPEPWIASLICTAREHRDWLGDVALCARRFAGDAILDLLWERDEDFAGEVESLFNTLPDDRDETIVLRSVRAGSPVPVEESRFRRARS